MDNSNSTFYKTIKGIGTYELVSKTGLIITIGLCYKYKPTVLLMSTQKGKNLINNTKKYFPTITNFVQNASQKLSTAFVTNSYLKRIPETFQLKSKRFGKSVTEAFVIYHLMIPIYAKIAYNLN